MDKLMQYGVIKIVELVEGAATHAIVFTCIQPGVIISMEKDIFLVYTRFSSRKQAEKKQHCFQPEESDYLQAERAGEMVTKLMLRLEGTEGLNYLYVLPTGLVSYLWADTLELAPAIIERMKIVLTGLCGEFHFINEPNVRVPTERQIDSSRRMGILLPI